MSNRAGIVLRLCAHAFNPEAQNSILPGLVASSSKCAMVAPEAQAMARFRFLGAIKSKALGFKNRATGCLKVAQPLLMKGNRKSSCGWGPKVLPSVFFRPWREFLQAVCSWPWLTGARFRPPVLDPKALILLHAHALGFTSSGFGCFLNPANCHSTANPQRATQRTRRTKGLFPSPLA